MANTAVRKTSDLIGPALDWAVCIAGGGGGDLKIFWSGYADYGMYHYSTNWAQGGPIIEREKIELVPSIDGSLWHSESSDCSVRAEWCPTPLIAAMRCYVASKLGEYVEIPESLLWEGKE